MCKIRYLKCPSCQYVFSEKQFDPYSFKDPCPYCKKQTGLSRGFEKWVSVGIDKCLEIAKNQKLDNDNEKVICIVFLCTALEVLLETVLYELIKTQKSKINLEKIWSRGKRIKEYERFSDCSLKIFLCSKGYDSFYDDWNKLAEVRNKIVHGKFFSRIIEDKIINKILDNCLKVFTEVHNDIQRKK